MIERLAAFAGRDVSRETFEKIERYVSLLREESRRQNLISASTLESIWERHIMDSAQLARFEPEPGSSWADIGAGAGLPGVVLACIVKGPITLIEPRRLRAEFLHRVCDALRINATVFHGKAERAEGKYDIITARAVARLPELVKISAHLSTRNTVWALPKGRNVDEELAATRRSWQGTFHVKQSVTDANSFIVVGTGVRARQ